MSRRWLPEIVVLLLVAGVASGAAVMVRAAGNEVAEEPDAMDSPAPPVAAGKGHEASHSEGRSMALARRISPSKLRRDPSSPVPDGAPQDDDCVFSSPTRFDAPEARQAVAVDERFVYVIGNQVIGKYDRETHERLAAWEGPEEGPIHHLNSGVVVDGKLYCAHSNYPDIPMTSSVEIWDTDTLEHVAGHSFGAIGGSLTWVDRHAGFWWAGFAQYTGEKAEPGRDPSWTQVVQLDERWQRLQGWVFPSEVVERFRPMSNSGASWGPDGLLYCTGHDNHEVYAMRLPEFGSTLELVKVVPVASFGQGIAWDRAPGAGRDLWGIIKARREVRVTRVEPVLP